MRTVLVKNLLLCIIWSHSLMFWHTEHMTALSYTIISITCNSNREVKENLSLIFTGRELSHDTKFFEATHAYFFNIAQGNELRMRNFEKFRIPLKISPSGKQALGICVNMTSQSSFMLKIFPPS